MNSPFKDIHKDAKERYINKSFQFLALKPELLKDVETDEQLIGRVITFAENLFKYDPARELF